MSFNTLVFRLHWIAGITAGMVLAVVGATGGLLAMEQPLKNWLNPQLTVEASQGAEALPPDTLIVLAQETAPALHATGMNWYGSERAVAINLSGTTRRDRRTIYLDPRTGAVLAAPRGDAFFHTVEDLHRRLAAGAIGKQIVGASTLLLLLLAISGLIQRWPRRHSLRAWLRPQPKLRGRGLWRNLHVVLGTWVLAFYLLAALTGLWWSYDFYRNTVNTMAGVTGSLRAARPALQADKPLLPVNLAWTTFRDEVPDATAARLNLGPDAREPLSIRYQTAGSSHERAWDSLSIDATDGTITARQPYAAQARGRRFVYSLFPLHTGSFFGTAGSVLMALACFLMPFFTISGFMLWFLRRRRLKQTAPSRPEADFAGLRPELER